MAGKDGLGVISYAMSGQVIRNNLGLGKGRNNISVVSCCDCVVWG